MDNSFSHKGSEPPFEFITTAYFRELIEVLIFLSVGLYSKVVLLRVIEW